MTWWETTRILMVLSSHHQLGLSRKQPGLLVINIHDVTGKDVREPWLPRRVLVLYQGLKSRTAEQYNCAEHNTRGSQGKGNQKLLRLGKNFHWVPWIPSQSPGRLMFFTLELNHLGFYEDVPSSPYNQSIHRNWRWNLATCLVSANVTFFLILYFCGFCLLSQAMLSTSKI